ncbi:MAG: hypothetical protein FWF43_00150 [Propionibacteriaceae bacterium]|nr:hypothetical protein [Propionibacteriaceae bacterium]
MVHSVPRILSFVCSGALVVGCLSIPVLAQADETNIVPDAALRQCLATAMHTAGTGASPGSPEYATEADSISQADLDALAAATTWPYGISCTGVASLEGLQYLHDPELMYLRIPTTGVFIPPVASQVTLTSDDPNIVQQDDSYRTTPVEEWPEPYWTNKDVTVTATSTDPAAAIRYTSVFPYTDVVDPQSASVENYFTGPLTFSTEGVRLITAWATSCDCALDVLSPASMLVAIDKTPPTVDSMQVDGGFTLVAHDNLSGVASVEYIGSENGPSDWTPYTSQVLALKGIGGTFGYRATDKAGNVFTSPIVLYDNGDLYVPGNPDSDSNASGPSAIPSGGSVADPTHGSALAAALGLLIILGSGAAFFTRRNLQHP